ncbi:MAG: 50S ribosomal protein L6 [Oscillospiraceae bacterium]|nr:50S ribosomal protein L6 [Oscillospiraceae bacterium]
MSRIGRMPIKVPAGVEVTVGANNVVTVKGKNGTLTESLCPDMTISREGDEITVLRPTEQKRHKSLHGLTRTLLGNMVTGVSEGFKKELEIEGVGYRAAKQGKDLVMNLGYSHQVIMPEIDGITVEVPAPNKIIVLGPDKQKVGHFAAEVRGKRPPEPYKGKGIRYLGERILRKEGKAGKK